MATFVQQLINGLTLGCIYGLLALSYTLIFGVLRVINFALGEALMVAAFSSIAAMRFAARWRLAETAPLLFFFLALFAALLGGMLIAVLTERVAFRPLRRRKDAPLILALISSLGLSIFLQNFFLAFVDSGNVNFPAAMPFKRISIGGAVVTATQIMIVACSVALMVVVSAIVYRTRLGERIRAIRDNVQLAVEYGVRPNRVIFVTFALSGLLAGFAGFAMGCQYGIARYNMGFGPGIKAFSAAILGGIGDVAGGLIGGALIGLVEAMSAGYLSAENKDVVVFVVLILTLLFRKRGLLGRGIE